MASHQSGIATGGYLEDLAEAARELEAENAGQGTVEVLGPWHTQPLYLQAVAARARSGLDRLLGAVTAPPLVLFSAHSLPLAGDKTGDSVYEAGLAETAQGVMALLGDLPWRLAYQSRTPRPGVRWLEPEVGEVLEQEAAAGRESVVVVPLGFVVEHLETLYDLDVDLAGRAQALGLRFARAETVQDDPSFVDMLATLALDQYAAQSLEAGR
jgi:protoporphyrin/coproporphyrin ferrochelatase